MSARRRRHRLAPAALLVATVVASGCRDGGTGSAPTTGPTGSSDGDVVLPVDRVPAAVAAVETARGGPQRYTEINVAPEGVNLFVVEGEGEVACVYGTELECPHTTQPAAGEPFAVDGADLDAPVRLAAGVVDRFPGSTVLQVALVVLEEQGLVWAVQHRSVRGGMLNSYYSPDGRLLGVAAA